MANRSSSVPPLVKLQIANPVTYLKLWWQKVVSGEGIDFRVRIHPLTAILLALILVGGGFGLGHFVLPLQIIQYVPGLASSSPTPSPTSGLWEDAALQGTLRYSSVTQKYYLSTTSYKAITLELPPTVDIAQLVGKKIFAVGKYNSKSDILIVADITSMAILPASPVPIPTLIPSPTPSPEPSVIPTPSP